MHQLAVDSIANKLSFLDFVNRKNDRFHDMPRIHFAQIHLCREQKATDSADTPLLITH